MRGAFIYDSLQLNSGVRQHSWVGSERDFGPCSPTRQWFGGRMPTSAAESPCRRPGGEV